MKEGEEKSHFVFILGYGIAVAVVFSLLTWHDVIPNLQITHSNLGIILQASLTLGAIFTFSQAIVLWRIDKYKNDRPNQEDILKDFKRYMRRYVWILGIMLILLIIWGFFDPDVDKSLSAYRYFALAAVSIIVCGLLYIFISSFSYIKELKYPTEPSGEKNGVEK